jgi:hypothetical protein
MYLNHMVICNYMESHGTCLTGGIYIYTLKFNILWHVDPLLGNDYEISKYTTAVTNQQLCKQACFHGNNWIQQQRNGVFCAIRAEVLQARHV